MNVTKVTLSLATFAVAVSCPLSARADAQVKQSIGYLEVTSDWPSAAWTDSDKPFLQAERDVNKRIAAAGVEVKRKKARAAVDFYHKLAMKDLSDATRVYQWAYATQQLTQIAPDYIQKEDTWLAERDALFAMMRPLSPSDYLYDRLSPGFTKLNAQGKLPKPVRSYRYLRMFYIAANNTDFARSGKYAQDFARLGTRLLSRNPKDVTVKALQTRLLGYSWHIAGKSLEEGDRELDPFKSLQFARELVRDYPNEPYYLILLAVAQRRNWNYKQNDNGADLALATYKKYLAARPSIPSYRGWAEASIQSLEKSKRFWQEHRKKVVDAAGI